ncbi:hypothetical protein RJ640_019625, partial [Escallonia rubra]
HKKLKRSAPAGNRTRVCTVAGYYSTTRPLVLLVLVLPDWSVKISGLQPDPMKIMGWRSDGILMDRK